MSVDDGVVSERERRAGSGVLDELFRRHEPELRAWLIDQGCGDRLVGVSVDDVIQVTRIEAYERFRQVDLDGLKLFPMWIRRTVRRNLIDAVRGVPRWIRPRCPHCRPFSRNEEGRTPAELLAAVIDDHPSPADVAVLADDRRVLEHALAKLPLEYSLVVRLRDLAGLARREVAEKMNGSVGAVLLLQARAYERLAELLSANTTE